MGCLNPFEIRDSFEQIFRLYCEAGSGSLNPFEIRVSFEHL